MRSFQMKLWKNHHDNSLKVHLATKKTYNIFYQKYFCFYIYKQVDQYFSSWLNCQRARMICEKQPEELQPLFIFTKILDDFSMNFITCPLISVKYKGKQNAICVIINKFSKMYH